MWRHTSGRLPRVGQHKNLLFVVHDIPSEPYPGPKVVVPPDVKELSRRRRPARRPSPRARWRCSGGPRSTRWCRTRGGRSDRKGKGYLALWSRQPTGWSRDGVFGGEGLVAEGRKNIWICQLGREKVDGPFAAWRARIAAARRRTPPGDRLQDGEHRTRALK
jgi:hypothetical protein